MKGFLKRIFSPKAVLGGTSRGVRQAGAGRQGTLSNWLVSRQNSFSESRDREAIVNRADDLTANDPHGFSAVHTKTINIAGTGFIPQSIPNERVLGITKEQAGDMQAQAEWAWQEWQAEADASGRLSFWMMQFLATWDFVSRGEFFALPVSLPVSSGRKYSFALQLISPLRVYTPTDLAFSEDVRDGVALGNYGQPVRYYVENVRDRLGMAGHRSSKDFAQIPARVAHRPGMLHGFIPRHTEAVRGVSALAPAIKMFKDFSDYLDFELVGAIIAASFPVFIETTNPYGVGGLTETADKRYYQETDPGSILYGNPNEKPHILKSDRPGGTFQPFVERLLRAVGSAVGLPYEALAKDFSQTNYSSARAALLEMWRETSLSQKWLIDALCQRAWDMVIEEAYLSGRFRIPKSAPDFYDFQSAYCRAKWTLPKKGHVDPAKEMKALVTGYDAGFYSLSDIANEMGTDWESLINQRRRERELMEEMGILGNVQ